MYELYSKWNLANTYALGNPEELFTDRTPDVSFFRFIEGETVKINYKGQLLMNEKELKYYLGRLDRELVARVAMSKYATATQLYEYMCMQGFEETKEQIMNHLRKLVNYRVLQDCYLMKPGENDTRNAICCFRLDYWGRIIALKENVPFHREILYLSYRKRLERGKEKNSTIEEDSAMKIKRILTANMILIGMLKSGVVMSRFGFVETFRPMEDRGWRRMYEDVPIFRTPLNVAFDKNDIRAYEVVRDCPEAYKKLENKMRRYYSLEASLDYLMDNFHGYEDAPQLVICGESWEHNLKIKTFLMEAGLWDTKLPILFTEDLLNLQNSHQSVYEISENNERIWYEMPIVKKNLVA